VSIGSPPFIFLKILFIGERERGHEQRGGGEGEGDSPPSRKPNMMGGGGGA